MGNLTIFTMNDGGDTMKEPLDLSKYSVRTVAVEAHQMLQERQEEQKG